MTILEICFWLCVVCVAYTYALYPLFIALVAALSRHSVHIKGRFAGSVSIVIPAYNEESCIVHRIHEFTRILVETGLDGEIIVISDGSTDRTADLIEEHANEYVRVLVLPKNVGKAEALTRGVEKARGDVIVFADARQHWAPDALEHLLQNFTDPAVGGASGDLIIESGPGMLSGVGRYWQYEKWIRRNESTYHSSIGVTGAISAVRRELFPKIPSGTVLDDVYWPMHVVLRGYRVVHDEYSLAYDRLPEKISDEFMRKLRTLAGNFQLMTSLPSLLLPWRNPVWFQLISHKVMRLAVPWALLALFIISTQLTQPIYHLALTAQLVFYFLGLIGIVNSGRYPMGLASVAGSFIVLNAAAFLAFWAWVSDFTHWHKVPYHHKAEAARTIHIIIDGEPDFEAIRE